MKTSNAEITHKPSTVAVFSSTDYDRFRMITGNRTLNMQKIKKILSDIDAGTNLLKYNPILVVARDGLLDIIDGQHRFVVSKKTKGPVHYILAEDLTLYQIARMNSNTEKWAPKDFIQCYVALENKHYKQLNDLLAEFPKLTVTCAIALLHTGSVTGGHDIVELFQRGEFESKQPERTRKILNSVWAFEFPQRFQRPFIAAIQTVIDAGMYDVSTLIEKVNAAPADLTPQVNKKKYLFNLQEIANKGKRQQVVIY